MLIRCAVRAHTQHAPVCCSSAAAIAPLINNTCTTAASATAFCVCLSVLQQHQHPDQQPEASCRCWWWCRRRAACASAHCHRPQLWRCAAAAKRGPRRAAAQACEATAARSRWEPRAAAAWRLEQHGAQQQQQQRQHAAATTARQQQRSWASAHGTRAGGWAGGWRSALLLQHLLRPADRVGDHGLTAVGHFGVRLVPGPWRSPLPDARPQRRRKRDCADHGRCVGCKVLPDSKEMCSFAGGMGWHTETLGGCMPACQRRVLDSAPVDEDTFVAPPPPPFLCCRARTMALACDDAPH